LDGEEYAKGTARKIRELAQEKGNQYHRDTRKKHFQSEDWLFWEGKRGGGLEDVGKKGERIDTLLGERQRCYSCLINDSKVWLEKGTIFEVSENETKK